MYFPIFHFIICSVVYCTGAEIALIKANYQTAKCVLIIPIFIDANKKCT